MAQKRLIVIGAGAAGYFCAVNAARLHPSLKVTIVEKTSKVLSKVRISGGGRCNVTHACFDIVEMSKRYPRGQNFVKKTFHQFFTKDTIQWFEERGVKIKAEEDGRMFPVSDSSESIIDCLIREANRYAVELILNAEVQGITKESDVFTVTLANGKQLTADYIIIASGGYPKSVMFEWLTSLGHTIAEPVPSLFTFNLPKHPITALMGVSVEKARIKIEGSKLTEEGPLLITHWGLSGPAVLKLSAWGARELNDKHYSFTVHINWLPEYNDQTLKEFFNSLRRLHASKKVLNHNPGLPNRLWQFLITEAGINGEVRFADLSAKAENALIRKLTDYIVEVKGKTTFKEEFVTAGGIKLTEVDPNTMMSKIVSGLYFAGEVLDIDGITGGYNFQNAWTTAWIAAKTIAGK
jgi:predicted Rossmann fold flavoprotein